MFRGFECSSHGIHMTDGNVVGPQVSYHGDESIDTHIAAKSASTAKYAMCLTSTLNIVMTRNTSHSEIANTSAGKYFSIFCGS
jgi:hypothetical protein